MSLFGILGLLYHFYSGIAHKSVAFVSFLVTILLRLYFLVWISFEPSILGSLFSGARNLLIYNISLFLANCPLGVTFFSYNPLFFFHLMLPSFCSVLKSLFNWCISYCCSFSKVEELFIIMIFSSKYNYSLHSQYHQYQSSFCFIT